MFCIFVLRALYHFRAACPAAKYFFLFNSNPQISALNQTNKLFSFIGLGKQWVEARGTLVLRLYIIFHGLVTSVAKPTSGGVNGLSNGGHGSVTVVSDALQPDGPMP